MRILLVEDNITILDAVTKSFEKAGYSVDTCSNGTDALNYIDLGAYDCIILDLVLPGMDGLSILRKIRGGGNPAPVLILSSRDTVEDRIKGLNYGADDYLVKPFSLEELLARVRALLRRQSSDRKNELTAGDLVMNLSDHVVYRDGHRIDLTTKEFAILEYLLRNKNRLLTRTQIVDHVWNYDFDCSSNIVDVYIRYLRTKLDEGFSKKLLATVRGSGYMLKEPE